MPGPPSGAVVPTSETHTPTSPDRRGDETPATTGPRNDSGPVLPSSVGSLAPPANGPSRAEPPGAGGSAPASSRRHTGSCHRPAPRSTTRAGRPPHTGLPPNPELA